MVFVLNWSNTISQDGLNETTYLESLKSSGDSEVS